MKDAMVRARTESGGRVSLLLGDRVLSDAPAVHVEIDRRVVTAWDAPAVEGSRVSGLLAGTRVHATWEAVPLGDGPVRELTLRLRNDGDTPVGITRMDPASLVLGPDWTTHAYRSAWGDEFRPFSGRASHDLVLDSRSGRSGNGADPWLGLSRADAAVVVSPAWSGNWHIHALSGGNVTAGISPWRFRVDLAPGEEVVAPSVVVAVGPDLDEVAVAVQRAVAGHLLPRTPWTDELAVEWNHWWPYEDAEVTEEVIAANARVAADLGIGVATVDAGWFGAADAASDWQEQRGDWHLVNTARFPSGLAALGDAIRDAGVVPGMWIEAEAVGRSSRLRVEHPELLALSDGAPVDPSYRFMTVSVDADDPAFLGYVCLGSEAGRAHVRESMSRLITETGARWIKLDFNIDPDAGCRRTDHGHGEGDGLLRHYEGLYAVLDEVRARHPEVLLESCSSGGLRIDLGLARHVHGFFLSDPDYTEHHLEVLWGARHLLPPAGILHWSWSQWRGDYPPSQLDWAALAPDDFDTMLRAAMPHRFGVSLRLVELREDLLERLRVHVDLYRRTVAPLVRDGVLRPLTASPERGGFGERAPALQLSAGDRHLVQAFVLPGGPGRAPCARCSTRRAGIGSPISRPGRRAPRRGRTSRRASRSRGRRPSRRGSCSSNRRRPRMHDDVALVEARLARFVRERLEPALYRDPRPLAATAWSVPGEPVPFAEAVTQEFAPVPLGWAWGRAWSTVWLHVTGEFPWPQGVPEGTRAELLVDFGYNRSRSGFQAEALAYRPDGTPIKAIAPLNSWLPWDGGPVDLYLEAAANPDVAGEYTFAPTPYGEWETSPEEPLYRLAQLEIALLDLAVWELRQDVWTLRGLMEQLPADSTRRHLILRAFEDMLDAVDPADVPGTAAAGRDILAPVLASPAASSAHRILATGHAHIDSAWLWPLRETVRKCARTFTNVMALMDEHPDFVFACSSAQQYLWMKQHHPAVWSRIKEKVAEGRFVPVGGMWVESDTNMPGSEAMARQFVAGKRFFLEEFGVECEEAWLPDSFGYSAALPQIVALAGERWFLTQKISWNQVNRMPHHTFQWEGIDGTRVFTHFPPADTYISEISGAELAHAERNFSEKGRAGVSLVPFGWGDGGGGPTREMIAAARRTADLEGSPRVTIGSPREFFEQAEAEYPAAPVWSGEMYLELHRGVLTSQLRTKQGNRRNEALLREAELWAATATLRTGAAYPAAELEAAWQDVLLLQFHDILPGSAIAWVHREAERRHAAVTATLERVVADALAALGDGGGDQIVNASPFPRDGIAPFASGSVGAHREVTAEVRDGEHVLDNGVIRVVVDAAGRVSSLVARADGREAIPAGDPAAALRIHRDLPNLWDAWDLDAHYRRTVTELDTADELTLATDADGAARVTSIRRIGDSTIELGVVLRPGAADVELDLRVDWRERERILKLAVPLDVHADRIAAETQFGHLFRPTHVNTSWDAARFEACQHRFVHVAEPGYGVAIANDSTYGYDVDRRTRADGGTTTTVRFSVIRAPRFPDPESDQGEHRLRYRLRPASGIADAVALGYDLALPARPVRTAAPLVPIVTSSGPGVVVETVKLAEDGSGDLVVRLYEALGGRARTTVAFDGVAERVEVTDLLERPLDGEPAADGAAIELAFRPFQIRTLRFRGVTAR